MSLMSDAEKTKGKRLASLRTRLLAFDYSEEIGYESLDLVEHLFKDLVSTTEVPFTIILSSGWPPTYMC
jgi:hypothetical protein